MKVVAGWLVVVCLVLAGCGADGGAAKQPDASGIDERPLIGVWLHDYGQTGDLHVTTRFTFKDNHTYDTLTVQVHDATAATAAGCTFTLRAVGLTWSLSPTTLTLSHGNATGTSEATGCLLTAMNHPQEPNTGSTPLAGDYLFSLNGTTLTLIAGADIVDFTKQ